MRCAGVEIDTHGMVYICLLWDLQFSSQSTARSAAVRWLLLCAGCCTYHTYLEKAACTGFFPQQFLAQNWMYCAGGFSRGRSQRKSVVYIKQYMWALNENDTSSALVLTNSTQARRAERPLYFAWSVLFWKGGSGWWKNTPRRLLMSFNSFIHPSRAVYATPNSPLVESDVMTSAEPWLLYCCTFIWWVFRQTDRRYVICILHLGLFGATPNLLF